MTTPIDVLRALTEPLPKFRFLVTLDPGDVHLPTAQAILLPVVVAGGFQEVTGLGGTLEVVSYAEGGRNDSVHQLPLRNTWKRGVVRDKALWTWYQTGLADSFGARRNGAVILLGNDGLPAMAWAFEGGLAAKWSGPDLHGEQNAVAVESLEIAHEGLTNVL
jgi:phage tail-like protein